MEVITDVREFVKTVLRKHSESAPSIVRGGPIDHDFVVEPEGRTAPKVFTIIDGAVRVGETTPRVDTLVFNCARQFAFREKSAPSPTGKLLFLLCDSAEEVNEAYAWLSKYRGDPSSQQSPGFEVIQNLSKFLDVRVRSSRVFERQALQPTEAARQMIVKFFDVINKSPIPYIIIANLFESIPCASDKFVYKLWFLEFLRELNAPIGAIYTMWGSKTNRFIKSVLDPHSREGDESDDNSQLVDIYIAILSGNDRIDITVTPDNFNKFDNNIEEEMNTLIRMNNRAASGDSEGADENIDFYNAKSKIGRVLADMLRAYVTLLAYPKSETTCLFIERSAIASDAEREETLTRIMIEKNLFYRETKCFNFLVGGKIRGRDETNEDDD